MSNENNNIDRLRHHLKTDSLAALLVEAYASPEGTDRRAALKKVLTDRLDAIRGALHGTED